MTTIATIVSDNKIQISILILWQGALFSHWKWTVMAMMIIVARKREKWTRFIKSGAGVELALLVLQIAKNAKEERTNTKKMKIFNINQGDLAATIVKICALALKIVKVCKAK